MQSRTSQRLFNPKDVDKADRSLARSKGYWIWNGDTYDKNGFLEKEIKIASLESENISPTLDEIAKFTGSIDGEDQIALTALAEIGQNKDENVQFHQGDLVTFMQGELSNAQGTVVSVSRNTVSVRMKEESLGVVDTEANKLTKAYQIGDHVKVVRGKFKDEAGMITQVEGSVVTIFSDVTMKQFSVFMKDVQGVAEVSTGPAEVNAYKLHDFVQIGYVVSRECVVVH
jgi:transcription elongation factor SPT5